MMWSMIPCSPATAFCSIVGQASIHTARPSGPSMMERSKVWELLDSTERLIHAHHAGEHLRLRLRHRILGLQLRPLGIEQREEIGNPFAIARTRDACGARALARLIVQFHQPLLLLAIAHQ